MRPEGIDPMSNRGRYMPGFLTADPNPVTYPQECCLNPGDYILSDNGLFVAFVQPDGQFAVYRGTDPATTAGEAMWVSVNGSYGGYVWDTPTAPDWFALTGLCIATTSLWKGFTSVCFRVSNVNPDYVLPMYEDGGSSDSSLIPWCSTYAFSEIIGMGLDLPEGTSSIYWKISDVGQFEIYSGTGPEDPASVCYCQHGPTDPVVNSYEITSVTYNLAEQAFTPAGNGKKTLTTSAYFINSTQETQDSQSWQYSTSQEFTAGWSNSFTEENSTSTTLSASAQAEPIPTMQIGGSASLTQETSISSSSEWDKSQSWTQSFTGSVQYVVPAYTVMAGIAQIASGTLSVPFTCEGTFTYSSGATLTATASGTYTGTASALDAQVVDVGYSIVTLEIDAAADYTASFVVNITSPDVSHGEVILWTSDPSPAFAAGENQSIDLADYALASNCFFVEGTQTNLYPVLTLSDGTTIVKGNPQPVYKPSPGNEHIAVYDCSAVSVKPTVVFDAAMSG
jgi:hypothetical protein